LLLAVEEVGVGKYIFQPARVHGVLPPSFRLDAVLLALLDQSGH
jgi:hypothetical protein